MGVWVLSVRSQAGCGDPKQILADPREVPGPFEGMPGVYLLFVAIFPFIKGE